MLKIFFITILLILTACHWQSEVLPKEKPDDFAFSLKYGVTAANEINSFDNTYTKDLIEDGTATTEMLLSDEEMMVIYEMFRSVNVLALPEEVGGSTCMDPYNRYKLTMRVDGKDYDLKWDNSCGSRALNKWEKMMDDTVLEMIYPKEEYQSLPEASGGYD